MTFLDLLQSLFPWLSTTMYPSVSSTKQQISSTHYFVFLLINYVNMLHFCQLHNKPSIYLSIYLCNNEANRHKSDATESELLYILLTNLCDCWLQHFHKNWEFLEISCLKRDIFNVCRYQKVHSTCTGKCNTATALAMPTTALHILSMWFITIIGSLVEGLQSNGDKIFVATSMMHLKS